MQGVVGEVKGEVRAGLEGEGRKGREARRGEAGGFYDDGGGAGRR